MPRLCPPDGVSATRLLTTTSAMMTTIASRPTFASVVSSFKSPWSPLALEGSYRDSSWKPQTDPFLTPFERSHFAFIHDSPLELPPRRFSSDHPEGAAVHEVQ